MGKEITITMNLQMTAICTVSEADHAHTGEKFDNSIEKWKQYIAQNVADMLREDHEVDNVVISDVKVFELDKTEAPV